MSVSEFYSDEELISQLRMFIDDDLDFYGLLSTVEEVDENTLQIKVKGRVFRFDKELCSVEEVE